MMSTALNDAISTVLAPKLESETPSVITAISCIYSMSDIGGEVNKFAK